MGHKTTSWHIQISSANVTYIECFFRKNPFKVLRVDWAKHGFLFQTWKKLKIKIEVSLVLGKLSTNMLLEEHPFRLNNATLFLNWRMCLDIWTGLKWFLYFVIPSNGLLTKHSYKVWDEENPHNSIEVERTAAKVFL